MENPAPLLQVNGLGKSYNVPVLVDFDFSLRAGEVHALVGSNGAGKSTFARILSGLTPPDGGSMELSGRPYSPVSKREAEDAGVTMVLQELNVIGTLSVAENIFLNRLPRTAGFIRYRRLHQEARRALDRVGLAHVSPSTPASALGMGQQQLVEIAGILARNSRLIILDEPTAALTDPEIEQLFTNIRRLQREGVGIIYISHRMDEIQRIANRITVMRDGRIVATHRATEVMPSQLFREMVGHDPAERGAVDAGPAGGWALQVENLTSGDVLHQISFGVRHGEILGIAGLIGSGRTETLRAIFGADAKDGGTIIVDGLVTTINTPRDALHAGIGLVPEDRKNQGLLLPQSVLINTTLGTIPQHANRFGWMDSAAEAATTTRFCDRLEVRCATTGQPVRELSGGNQQKVVIARWLACDCGILLFDEPTRGIDAAAKDTIYQLLRELAAQSRALVVVSSELLELMAVCDRILVLSRGRITAEFTPSTWTQEKVTQAAFAAYLDTRDSKQTK